MQESIVVCRKKIGSLGDQNLKENIIFVSPENSLVLVPVSEVMKTAPCSSSLVTVTSLDPTCTQEDRVLFLAEARGLATLRCSNIATILGLGLGEEPLLMVTEAGDMGDLNMFLQVPLLTFRFWMLTLPSRIMWPSPLCPSRRVWPRSPTQHSSTSQHR